jgi:hypothetical protein
MQSGMIPAEMLGILGRYECRARGARNFGGNENSRLLEEKFDSR